VSSRARRSRLAVATGPLVEQPWTLSQLLARRHQFDATNNYLCYPLPFLPTQSLPYPFVSYLLSCWSLLP